MDDVCAIIVSHNDRRFLDGALASLFEHAGGLDLDVVVVDNGEDGAAEYAEKHFEGVRGIRCANRGFGHANNRALETADARYVLFLNPDTEILDGNLCALVSALDRRPRVGLAGVRQLRGDGSLAPTIRRFPSVGHTIAEALGVERVPGVRRVLGERELDTRQYDRETPCDWTSGSFMLVRTTALEAAGWFDERFFLFSEETDLCWRLKRGGWGILHMPLLTIRHHEREGPPSAMLAAQSAYARLQFAEKHFAIGAMHYRWALALRYSLRVVMYSLRRRDDRGRRRAAAAALLAVLNRQAPFEEWNAVAGAR